MSKVLFTLSLEEASVTVSTFNAIHNKEKKIDVILEPNGDKAAKFIKDKSNREGLLYVLTGFTNVNYDPIWEASKEFGIPTLVLTGVIDPNDIIMIEKEGRILLRKSARPMEILNALNPANFEGQTKRLP